MKIQAINNYQRSDFSSNKNTPKIRQNLFQDSFVFSDVNNSSISFGSSMFLKRIIGPLIGRNLIKPVEDYSDKAGLVNDYHRELSKKQETEQLFSTTKTGKKLVYIS